jgi:death on curing protein
MRLSSADIMIELHDESIEAFGGMPGFRDRGALDGSLGRAQHLLDYADPAPDAIDVACGICASICRNHAFTDGNKRAAFIALGVTLELNGFFLDARETEAINTMLALAAGTLGEAELAHWVRANVVELLT